MDYDSNKNQKIKKEFVEREVLYCVSYLISELSKNTEYSEELLPVLQQEDFDSAIEYILQTEAIKNVTSYLGVAHKEDIAQEVKKFDAQDKSDMCNHFYAEPEYRDAFEHWIVTGFLAEKLEGRGEMVLHDFYGLTIWGRSCTGQPIYMDGVISQICEGRGILEGQKHEWLV